MLTYGLFRQPIWLAIAIPGIDLSNTLTFINVIIDINSNHGNE